MPSPSATITRANPFKPWIEAAALTVILSFLLWILAGCAGTSGSGSVTLGPGDTVTIGGSWTSPARSGAVRALATAKPPAKVPLLPGHYSTNSAGDVSIALTNRVRVK